MTSNTLALTTLANSSSIARKRIELWAKGLLFVSASISIAVTGLIIFSVLFESIHFFSKVPVTDFLFGTEWSPQTAIRADQAGSSGSFGIIPLLAGTLLITFIAMIVAVPLGLYSAVYLSEYASKSFRNKAKPI